MTAKTLPLLLAITALLVAGCSDDQPTIPIPEGVSVHCVVMERVFAPPSYGYQAEYYLLVRADNRYAYRARVSLQTYAGTHVGDTINLEPDTLHTQ
jgi:hypothetical protein